LIADKQKEIVQVDFSKYTPAELIAAPKSTSHYRLVLAAASIDFEKGLYAIGSRYSGYLSFDSSPVPTLSLDFVLTCAQNKPWFVSIGIEFFQEVNNIQYSLNNGAYNAMSVVKVVVK
jgi:hypothetical protein